MVSKDGVRCFSGMAGNVRVSSGPVPKKGGLTQVADVILAAADVEGNFLVVKVGHETLVPLSRPSEQEIFAGV